MALEVIDDEGGLSLGDFLYAIAAGVLAGCAAGLLYEALFPMARYARDPLPEVIPPGVYPWRNDPRWGELQLECVRAGRPSCPDAVDLVYFSQFVTDDEVRIRGHKAPAPGEERGQ